MKYSCCINILLYLYFSRGIQYSSTSHFKYFHWLHGI